VGPGVVERRDADHPRRMLEYTDHALLNQGRFDIESVTHIVTGRSPGLVPPAGSSLLSAPGPRRFTRTRSPDSRSTDGRPYYAESEAARSRLSTGSAGRSRDRVVVEDPDRPLRPGATASGSARIHGRRPGTRGCRDRFQRTGVPHALRQYDPRLAGAGGRPPAPVAARGRVGKLFARVYVPEGRPRVAFATGRRASLTGLAIKNAGPRDRSLLIVWPRRLASLRPRTTSWPGPQPGRGGCLRRLWC